MLMCNKYSNNKELKRMMKTSIFSKCNKEELVQWPQQPSHHL